MTVQTCRGTKGVKISRWERQVVGEKKEKHWKDRKYVFIFFSGCSHSSPIFQDPSFYSSSVPYLFSFLSSQFLLYVTTCCPHSSMEHVSPSSCFILFHWHCLKPISQIGYRGPVSHHLTCEYPSRGPNWRQPRVRGIGRASIPASVQCFWDATNPGPIGMVLGEKCSMIVLNAV